ncbi:ABC transporter ATP-binding protein [Opitutaceae bacterium]|nr:ABC transporter ATP-binding protein [Opitutaceae bacterium]
MAASAISFADVTKDFPLTTGEVTIRALDCFSLSVSAGEVVALLGPNGSGKSTAIKLALGLIPPTRGAVLVEGAEADSVAARQQVGYVPDVGGIPLHVSGREALAWWAKINDWSATSVADRVAEVLAEVDLEGSADRPVAEYSRGMKKRLALAQAILPKPRRLLLDEPFAGLDPLAIDQQVAMLQRLAEEGCTILLSSHLLSRVEALADRVVLLHRGRSIAVGPPEELIGTSAKRQRRLDDVFRERVEQAEEATR